MHAITVLADNPRELAEQCWAWLSEQIRSHQADSERPFALALAGGSTPRMLYEIAGRTNSRHQVDWQRVILLWGDERHVPLDHPDSNYGMVAETLLRSVSIPPENILAVPDPGGDPSAAAAAYERLLADRLAKTSDGFPRIDGILLGMGDDVHTASLFPDTQGLKEDRRSVIANYVPQGNCWRITLTFPVINAATRVAFLISGSSKRQALRSLWYGPRDSQRFPAQGIQPQSGCLYFFVDQAALGDTPIPTF